MKPIYKDLKVWKLLHKSVVIDDYPTYTPSKIRDAAARNLQVRVDAVDSNGIFPMNWAEKEFTTAYSFRKYVQKKI